MGIIARRTAHLCRQTEVVVRLPLLAQLSLILHNQLHPCNNCGPAWARRSS